MITKKYGIKTYGRARARLTCMRINAYSAWIAIARASINSSLLDVDLINTMDDRSILANMLLQGVVVDP